MSLSRSLLVLLLLPLPMGWTILPVVAQTTTPNTTEPSSTVITISKIEVAGNTLFKQEIAELTKSFINKKLSFEELNGIADSITSIYVNNGFITSLAFIPPQSVSNGVVRIDVVEGNLEQIKVEGLQRLHPDYILSRVKQARLAPFDRESLEEQLKLLRANPLFQNIEASLRPGSKTGQSVLTLKVTEANPLISNFSVDNYSPPSVGGERLGVSFTYLNLFAGIGDQLSASFNRSFTGGSTLFDFSYQVPINAMNGTIELRYAPSGYRITDPAFSALNIRGSSDLLELNFRQPLLRSPRQELALSLGFTYISGQTFLFDNLPTPFGIGADANGVTRTSVLKFGQEYVSRDAVGAWGVRSQFSLGLGIFNATSNIDPIPDGNFFAWLGQLQRVQVINEDNFLIFQTDVQLTPNTLLPSQQFVIGGGQSVRGFRQNARSADNGVRISVENRFTVVRNASGEPVLQLVPFVDTGVVWNTAGNPNVLSSQNWLAGGGIGVIWQPITKLTARLEYALPFVNLSDRGGNIQDSAFYFSLNYRP